jgi:hypothetical protein
MSMSGNAVSVVSVIRLWVPSHPRSQDAGWRSGCVVPVSGMPSGSHRYVKPILVPASSATASSVPRIVEYDQRRTGTVDPATVVVVPTAVVVVPATVVVVVAPPVPFVVRRRSSMNKVDAEAVVFWKAILTTVPAINAVLSRHDIVWNVPVAAGSVNDPTPVEPISPESFQVPVPL